MLPFAQTDCTRAREAVSSRLDGESAELERERLDLHLRHCADCSRWAEQVEDATRRLRDAQLELPGTGVALPRRARRRTGAVALVATPLTAAAAIALAVFGPLHGSVAGGQHGSTGPRQTTSTASHLPTVAAPKFRDERLVLPDRSLLTGVSWPATSLNTFRPI